MMNNKRPCKACGDSTTVLRACAYVCVQASVSTSVCVCVCARACVCVGGGGDGCLGLGGGLGARGEGNLSALIAIFGIFDIVLGHGRTEITP